MDFGFSEEQDLLRDQARKFLAATCGMSVVRHLAASEAGYSPEMWRQIAELGWLGIAIPEAHGGAGLGWLDLVILLEEMGRGLVPAPFASTVLAAAAIVDSGSSEQTARWLPRIVQGESIATLALFDAEYPHVDAVSLEARRDGGSLVLSGEKPCVHDAGTSDLFVVAFRLEGVPQLAVVERDDPGVVARSFRSIDATKRLGHLILSEVRVEPERLLERGSPNAIERAAARGALAMAAEIAGAAEEALRITTEYAKQRIQFGEPIGRFQGVKHPLADMFVDVESFKSLLYYAAWALDEERADASRAVYMTKAYASEAFARIGIDAIQLHGAVGYTDEYDIQLYLKRSKWARPAFGDADFHYERVAQFGGL